MITGDRCHVDHAGRTANHRSLGRPRRIVSWDVLGDPARCEARVLLCEERKCFTTSQAGRVVCKARLCVFLVRGMLHAWIVDAVVGFDRKGDDERRAR